MKKIILIMSVVLGMAFCASSWAWGYPDQGWTSIQIVNKSGQTLQIKSHTCTTGLLQGPRLTDLVKNNSGGNGYTTMGTSRESWNETSDKEDCTITYSLQSNPNVTFAANVQYCEYIKPAVWLVYPTGGKCTPSATTSFAGFLGAPSLRAAVTSTTQGGYEKLGAITVTVSDI